MNEEDRKRFLDSFRTDRDSVKDLENFLTDVGKISNMDDANTKQLEEQFTRDFKSRKN